MPYEPDPLFQRYVANAFRRFDFNLKAALPRSAPKLDQLLSRVPKRPEHVFDVRAFPMMALPFWLSPRERRIVDAEFQSDLIYSSLCGYYAIRLCDNIADDDGSPELRKLAPCTLYFDNEAIRAYMKYFSGADEFWRQFDELVAQQAEASAADGLLADIDQQTFASLSSKKFTGAKIPLLAVRHHYGIAPETFERWETFVDVLGDCAQFNNDFFDWRRDSKNGIVTYLSSEARRRAPGESLEKWFLREGFEWGLSELKIRIENVRLLAKTLDNPTIADWLAAQDRVLESNIAGLRSIVEATNKFMNMTSAL